MKLELGQMLHTLANVAVLAGLVFVALEIRQSNRIAIGTTSNELSRNWNEINDLILTSADVRGIALDLANGGVSPSDADNYEQAMAYARRLLNNWIAIEDGYRNGIVSDQIYALALADVKGVIGKRPGLIPLYEEISVMFDISGYELLDPIRAALEGREESVADER